MSNIEGIFMYKNPGYRINKITIKGFDEECEDEDDIELTVGTPEFVAIPDYPDGIIPVELLTPDILEILVKEGYGN